VCLLGGDLGTFHASSSLLVSVSPVGEVATELSQTRSRGPFALLGRDGSSLRAGSSLASLASDWTKTLFIGTCRHRRGAVGHVRPTQLSGAIDWHLDPSVVVAGQIDISSPT
jgi:hypothetical protein